MARTDFKPIEQLSCPECGRIAGPWYDERDADMVVQFKAGVTTERLAKGYGLSGRRVQEIIRDRLGMEVMWRIIRTHGHNTESEEE